MKAKAKDQLLGNYGIATGSFALLFALCYGVMVIVMSAFYNGISDNVLSGAQMSIGRYVETQILSIVITLISVIFSVGYLYILRRISAGDRPALSELFFVFKNHPDKVIMIGLIMTVTQAILLLPSNILSFNGIFRDDGTFVDGKKLFLWVLLYLTGFIISLVIDIMLAMSFMIYLDDPETPVIDIVKGSISMMRGNKFRYFYMLLSFIGYWILIILSLGIAMLWVVPYQSMTALNFYDDIKDSTNVEVL